jgi:hypothetical protein
MLAALLARLDRWATGRNVLFLLAAFLIINLGIMPMAGARLQAASGGLGPLDLELAYSPAEAFARVAALGPDGRQFYALIELTADVIYPIIYGLFFSLAIAYCLRALGAERLRAAALLPLAGAVFDLLENAGIVTLLLTFPQTLTAVAVLASLATTIKWVFALSAMAVLLIALVALAARRLRGQAGARA